MLCRYNYNSSKVGWINSLILNIQGATASAHAKSCKIQKVVHFTRFEQRNTHINGCKIVYKCTSATVTVHICMITVTRAFNILVFFW